MSGYENKQVYPVSLSKEKSENLMELFLVWNKWNSQGNKSQDHKLHYIKNNRFMYNKTKLIEENFCVNCVQYFSSQETLTNHKKVCLKISGKQKVNTCEMVAMFNVQFYNCQQLQALFVIYTGFECNLMFKNLMEIMLLQMKQCKYIKVKI